MRRNQFNGVLLISLVSAFLALICSASALTVTDAAAETKSNAGRFDTTTTTSAPIIVTLTIEGTGNSSISQFQNKLVSCGAYDTVTSSLSTNGVSTLNVTKGNALLDGSGTGLLYTLSCQTTSLSSFGVVVALDPASVPTTNTTTSTGNTDSTGSTGSDSSTVLDILSVTNWATMSYAVVVFAMFLIMLVVFGVSDYSAAQIYADRFFGKTSARPAPIMNIKCCNIFIHQVLMNHMWLSLPTSLLLSLSGHEPIIKKYQRLACWYSSLISYSVASVGILGSLKAYWNWTGLYGEGDLLGRDFWTLMSSYWAPTIITSLIAGKGVHIVLSSVFARFSFDAKKPTSTQGLSLLDKAIIFIMSKFFSESFTNNVPVNIVANLVLMTCCALFIIGMNMASIWIGVHFLVIQGALWMFCTLFAVLIDAVVLDPIYIMAQVIAKDLADRMQKGSSNSKTRAQKPNIAQQIDLQTVDHNEFNTISVADIDELSTRSEIVTSKQAQAPAQIEIILPA